MPDVTLSEAIKEARASAPTGVIEYDTIEIRHPSFTNPIYLVRGFDSISARLEVTAPVNAGAIVDFIAAPFDLIPPDVTNTALPVMKLTVDNVSRDIGASIELAITTTDMVEVTYRNFLSTSLLDGPENDPPLTLKIMTVEMDAFKVTATCGYPLWQNRKFPTKAYSSDVFPGLVVE